MKTAVVTGGSRGIGSATVKKFAEAGYSVILNYNRSENEALNIKKQADLAGWDVHVFQANLTVTEQLDALFDYVTKYFKKLDVLVNNAGVSLYKQIQDVTVAEYDKVMNVNCKAAFFASKRAAEIFLKTDVAGSIVNVSSIWGLLGASCETVYSMSKFALLGLTLSLSKELLESGIRVNAVCPPIVNTSMNVRLTPEEISAFTEEYKFPVLGVEDVAKAVFTAAESKESGLIIDKFGGV